MKLEEKIRDLVKQHGKSIVILKGFDTKILPQSSKYFSFNIDYYDKVDLVSIKEIVIDEIIGHRTFPRP